MEVRFERDMFKGHPILKIVWPGFDGKDKWMSFGRGKVQILVDGHEELKKFLKDCEDMNKPKKRMEDE